MGLLDGLDVPNAHFGGPVVSLHHPADHDGVPNHGDHGQGGEVIAIGFPPQAIDADVVAIAIG